MKEQNSAAGLFQIVLSLISNSVPFFFIFGFFVVVFYFIMNAGRSTSRLLRYPLRSASKIKEEKPPVADASNGSSSKAR